MKYFKKTIDTIYIPNTKSKINIVQISDLHYSKLVSEKKLLEIIKKIKELKPNYITITGDSIDSVESINNQKDRNIIINFFNELSKIAPIMLSLGNHDFSNYNKKLKYDYKKDFWNKINEIPNIHLLNNETFKNDEIEFFGYTQPWEYFINDKHQEDKEIMINDLKKLKKYLQESNTPKIGLIHSPANITDENIKEQLKNFDIILCGHMHNGCIPPLIDETWKSDIGIISANKKLFSHNCRGKIVLNNEKNTNLIISGALTTFSKCSPKLFHPFNLFFPYYINQIIITSDKKEENKKRKYKYYK